MAAGAAGRGGRAVLPGEARGRNLGAGVVVLVCVLIGGLLSSCNGQRSRSAHPRVLFHSTTTGPAAVPRRGYWLMSAAGQIFAFGFAVGYGSRDAASQNRPVVCMSSTPSGRGYWLVAADGGIFAFGDAGYYGSTAPAALARPIVGMAATPTGHGYWLTAADGAVFAFGDARVYGSMVGRLPDQPIVGIAPTPSGLGYWLVSSDGGVFGFGHAGSYGSARSVHLNAPVIGMTSSPSGRGYLLAAADGGIFRFGDAHFYGAPAGQARAHAIVALAATPTGRGYWLTAADGTVLAYGDAQHENPWGRRAGTTILGMAALGGAGMCHASDRPADIAAWPGTVLGEGHWVAAGRPVGGEPAIYTTVLRARAGLPDAGLAWIDASQVVFRLYAGADQPRGTFRYGNFVDPTAQALLLATFNSGFKVDASEGGWAAYGQTAIPLRDGAASFIIRSDGTATVGMWGRDATADPHVVAVRQNLTLLIDGGKVASDLSPQSWGAVFGGGPTTWRSGLGVDANGHLIYAVGADLLPSDLAHLLLAAGSVRAMQLDINRVVSFSTFSTPTGSPSQTIVGSNLLPTINFDPNRYLQPSRRDFVAVFAK